MAAANNESSKLQVILAASILLSALIYLFAEPADKYWAILALGVFAIGIWIGALLAVPSRDLAIKEILGAAKSLGSQDFSHRLYLGNGVEETATALRFNEAVASLAANFKSLLLEKDEQEAVLLSMREGIVAVDNDDKIIRINNAASKMLGFNAQEAIGRQVEEVIRDSQLQAFLVALRHSNSSFESEIDLHNPKELCILAQGDSLLDRNGNNIGFLLVLSDITRVKQLELVRRDFVANVSHELRTPITSIKGFVETLLDGALDSPVDAKRFVQIIARQADRLDAIFEDLLSLSRIEQEKNKDIIPKVIAPIMPILNAAVESVTKKAQQKNLTINIDCASGLTGYISQSLLEQAVVNLLENAIRYSESGKKIWVQGLLDGDFPMIVVRDQGIGIEEMHLSRIFERFYRADRGRGREQGGTGLGLSIVKHIAEAHGGSVKVESKAGEGSVFTMYLGATPAMRLVAS